MEAEKIKQIVKDFIEGEDPETFERNKHGQIMLTSESGGHTINLEYYLIDLVEFALEKVEQPPVSVMPSDYKEPLLMSANDNRVLVNGRPLPVAFRIVAEDNYQKLISSLSKEAPKEQKPTFYCKDWDLKCKSQCRECYATEKTFQISGTLQPPVSSPTSKENEFKVFDQIRSETPKGIDDMVDKAMKEADERETAIDEIIGIICSSSGGGWNKKDRYLANEVDVYEAATRIFDLFKQMNK